MLLANNAMIISFWLNSYYLGLHTPSFQLSGKLIKYGLQQKSGHYYALQIYVVCRIIRTDLYLIPDCTADESLSMHGQSMVQHSGHKLGVSFLHSIS